MRIRPFFGLLTALLLIMLPAAHLASAAPIESPMLAQTYEGRQDVTGWWMSEKLDGVRGYWDGQRLWSKHGHQFTPPEAFTAGFPPFALEGELWGGRGTFESSVSIVMQEQPHDGWLTLRFAVFDVPEPDGPFEQRLRRATRWFEQHPCAQAFVIEQIPVSNPSQLDQALQRIEKQGGEGLIVRDPTAPYSGGRSATVLKVKRYQDAEAIVMAHLPGSGRNQGQLGALLVQRPDGVQFKLGTGFSDQERKHPPAIGSVITYKFYGRYASGLPKFPVYLRRRGDAAL